MRSIKMRRHIMFLKVLRCCWLIWKGTQFSWGLSNVDYMLCLQRPWQKSRVNPNAQQKRKQGMMPRSTGLLLNERSSCLFSVISFREGMSIQGLWSIWFLLIEGKNWSWKECANRHLCVNTLAFFSYNMLLFLRVLWTGNSDHFGVNKYSTGRLLFTFLFWIS